MMIGCDPPKGQGAKRTGNDGGRLKVEKEHTVGFFDVDHEFKLRIESAARFFQDMATFHSTRIGAGPSVLMKRGVIWFLNRLEIEFFRYPVLGEEITVTTWSRGFKRFKGLREYQIRSSKGEIARGSSVWIFFDVNRQRISKIPEDISRLYTAEPERNFDQEIDAWQSCGRIPLEKQMDISLRYSDFDVNGHVNNTVYLGFLETLFHQTIKTDKQRIQNVKIRFCREIGKTGERIRAGWQRENGAYLCNICDDTALYADARIIAMG